MNLLLLAPSSTGSVEYTPVTSIAAQSGISCTVKRTPRFRGLIAAQSTVSVEIAGKTTYLPVVLVAAQSGVSPAISFTRSLRTTISGVSGIVATYISTKKGIYAGEINSLSGVSHAVRFLPRGRWRELWDVPNAPNTLNGQLPWTLINGNLWGVVDSEAELTGPTGQTQIGRMDLAMASPDHEVIAVIDSEQGVPYFGPVVRIAGSLTMYGCGYGPGTGFYIFRLLNGSQVTLGDAVPATPTFPLTMSLKAKVNGATTDLTLTANGIPIMTRQDDQIQGALYTGMQAWLGAGAKIRVSEFQAGPIFDTLTAAITMDVAAQSSISASVKIQAAPKMALAAQSGVVGARAKTRKLTMALAAQSAMISPRSMTAVPHMTIDEESAVAADMAFGEQNVHAFAGKVSGQSAVLGRVVISMLRPASVDAQGGIAGTFSYFSHGAILGDVVATSQVLGRWAGVPRIAARIPGQSTVAASISTYTPPPSFKFKGLVAAQSTVHADFSGPWHGRIGAEHETYRIAGPVNRVVRIAGPINESTSLEG